MSFNKSILIGNITADPELKQTSSGTSVCSFSIAVNRRFAKDGEQSVDFISVVAWRQQAEFVAKYFKKGSPILVCGQIQTRSWTDNQGQKRYTTEVVADEVSFAGARGQNADKPAEPRVSVPPKNKKNEYVQQSMQMPPKYEELPNDDSLPF